MRYLISSIVLLAWGTWFGGCVMLFISVIALFKFDYALAVQAAPRLFVTFGKFQLVVGAVALLGTFGWYVLTRRRIVTWLLALFMLAAIGASMLALTIVPRMEELRAAGQSGTPPHRALHKLANAVYSLTTIALLIAGCLLPAATRQGATSSSEASSTVTSGAGA